MSALGSDLRSVVEDMGYVVLIERAFGNGRVFVEVEHPVWPGWRSGRVPVTEAGADYLRVLLEIYGELTTDRARIREAAFRDALRAELVAINVRRDAILAELGADW